MQKNNNIVINNRINNVNNVNNNNFKPERYQSL